MPGNFSEGCNYGRHGITDHLRVTVDQSWFFIRELLLWDNSPASSSILPQEIILTRVNAAASCVLTWTVPYVYSRTNYPLHTLSKKFFLPRCVARLSILLAERSLEMEHRRMKEARRMLIRILWFIDGTSVDKAPGVVRRACQCP